jgi:hypothetical protein
MRNLFVASLIAMLAAGPAMAQTTGAAGAMSVTPKPHTTHIAHSGVTPVDHGPYTAEANKAYEGGGMILQGAPGAPPPRPEATPPGQMPRNMVPQ